MNREAEWCKWFAWYPVMISNKTVWLKTVERKFYWEHYYSDNNCYIYRRLK